MKLGALFWEALKKYCKQYWKERSAHSRAENVVFVVILLAMLVILIILVQAYLPAGWM
jgi:hypothetical protein